MTTEKIPISFNEQDITNIEELAHLLFGGDVYGAIPKAVKFGITFTLSCIKNPQKVYTGLNEAELDFYFSSIKRFELQARLIQKAKELENQAQKV